MNGQNTTYQLDTNSLLTVNTKPWEASWMSRPVYAIDRMDLDPSASHGNQHLCAMDLLGLFLHDIEKGCFVSCRTSASNYPLMRALEASGFHLIETYLYLTNSDITKHNAALPSVPVKIGPCTEVEIERVMAIASTSFAHDRFHSDPNIPDSIAGYSRSLWVQNTLKDPSKKLTIALRNGQVVGFNCTKEQNSRIIIDLIGVDPNARGQGIGSVLVRKMFQDALADGIRASGVGTQAHNLPSVRFYRRLGYTLSETFYTFHLHL